MSALFRPRILIPVGLAGGLLAALLVGGVADAATPGGGHHHGHHHRGQHRQQFQHATFDIQNGKITAISPSSVSPTTVTVTSPDGFVATYTFTPQSKVRINRAPASPSQLVAGEKVHVVAQRTTAGDEVRRLGARS